MLREVSTDSFLLVEESSTRSRCPVPPDMVCEDEETESAMASAHDQREEELQVKQCGWKNCLKHMPLCINEFKSHVCEVKDLIILLQF
jgi:hypothetical protein